MMSVSYIFFELARLAEGRVAELTTGLPGLSGLLVSGIMGELPTGRVEELPTGGLADGLLASLLLLSALSGMEDLVVFNKQILFPLKLLRLDPKLTSQLRWPNLIQRCYNVIWLPGCICDFYNFPYYKLTF